MERYKTVFVLGAGASQACGYPLGSELIQDMYKKPILSRPCELSPNRSRPYYEVLNCDKQTYELFQTKLEQSTSPSIDLFLENNPQFEDIGRCEIAAQLILHEFIDILKLYRDNSEFWYHELFNRIGVRKDDFIEGCNDIEIITFNYDRSLEYFFYEMVQTTFDTSKEFAGKFVTNKLRIHHVYGQLCPPYFSGQGGRTYVPEINIEIIRNASKEIKLINRSKNDLDENNAFQIKSTIFQAKKVVFLGFGYHKENISVLMPNFQGESPHPDIYGTGINLGREDIRKINNLFDSKHSINIEPIGIKQLFKDYPIFG